MQIIHNLQEAHQLYRQGRIPLRLLQDQATVLIGMCQVKHQGVAEHFLAKGWVHIVSTDAHGVNRRAPRLNAAYRRVQALGNAAMAERLFHVNPRHVAAGQDVPTKSLARRTRRSGTRRSWRMLLGRVTS